MQIVIDIDDGLARYIRNDNSVPTKSDYELLVNAIYRGTPLPKNHGRLIDDKNLIEELECTFDGTLAKTWNEMALLITDIIEEVPTIIEADRSDDYD